MNLEKLIGHSPFDICSYLKNKINGIMQPLSDKYEAFSLIQDIDISDDSEIEWTDDEYLNFITTVLKSYNCVELRDNSIIISGLAPQYWNIGEEDVFLGYYSDKTNTYGLNSVNLHDDVFTTIELNQDNSIKIITIHPGLIETVMTIPAVYNYVGESSIEISLDSIIAGKNGFLALNPVRDDVGRRFRYSTYDKSSDYNIYYLMNTIPDHYIACQIFNDAIDSIVRGDFSNAELQSIINKYGGVESLDVKSMRMYQDLIPVFATNNIVAATKLLYDMFVVTEESIEADPEFSDAPAIASAINLGTLLTGVFNVLTSAATVVLAIFVPLASMLFATVNSLFTSIWSFVTDFAGVSFTQNNDALTTSRLVNLPFYRGLLSAGKVPASVKDALAKQGGLAKFMVPGGECRCWMNPNNDGEYFIEFCPSLDYCIIPPKINYDFSCYISDTESTEGYTLYSSRTGKALMALTDRVLFFNPYSDDFYLDVDDFIQATFYPLMDVTAKISDGEIMIRILSAMLIFIFWLNSTVIDGRNQFRVFNGYYYDQSDIQHVCKLGAFFKNTPWLFGYSSYDPEKEAYLNGLLYMIIECFDRCTFSNVSNAEPAQQSSSDLYVCNYYASLSDDDVRIISALSQLANLQPLKSSTYDTLNLAMNAQPSTNKDQLAGYQLNVQYYSYYGNESSALYNHVRSADFSAVTGPNSFWVDNPAGSRKNVPFNDFLRFLEESVDPNQSVEDLCIPYSTGWYIEVPTTYPSSLITTAVVTTALLSAITIGGTVGFAVMKKKAKQKMPAERKQLEELQQEVNEKAGQPGEEQTTEYKVAYKKYMRASRKYNLKARMFGLPKYDSSTAMFTSASVKPNSPLPDGIVANSFITDNPNYSAESNIEATSPGEQRIIDLIAGFN